IFLEYTLNHQVAEYPFGAGAGRWGMMSYYFADPAALIWAEIQWTGWLLDGGIPLVLAQTVAMLLVVYSNVRLIRRLQPGPLLFWAALILGMSIGVIASTFNNCGFSTTIGLVFWLLNAALMQAVHVESLGKRQGRRPCAAPGP